MPEIILKNVTKKFGDHVAVENLNMTIKDKEFVTLLGPSGCGKTTTLRMIAGLETPTEGEISIDDKVVFSSEKGIDLSPAKRDIGFLFQNYALWPHMTVYKNIVFGLENLKWAKDAINQRVKELTTLLKIDEYLERYPSELSGGQQQRVAIARTLAPNPKVLFMDEPLSNLDAKLRMDMRSELKRIHMETDSTFVYVTHDQLEAMTLSSRICLLREGVLQQYDPPLEIYNNPANTFIADFVGNPTMNFIDVICDNTTSTSVEVSNSSLRLNFFIGDDNENTFKTGAKLILGMRPEHIEIVEGGKVNGEVYSSLPSGLETIFKIDINGLMVTSIAFGGVDYKVGTTLGINFNSNKYILFEKENSENIAQGRVEVLS